MSVAADPMTRKAPARRCALDRQVAMRLAAQEYDRVRDHLGSLPVAAWERPSGCAGWDVRELAAHVLGMATMASSVREQVRQNVKAARAGGVFIDALTRLQVAERRQLTPQQIMDKLTEITPRAVRGRQKTPAFLRGRAMPVAQPVGGKPDSPTERWTFGYLTDTILTRDPWMHRTDLAGATGTPLVLTAEHDGVLVADVVAEWAGRHGQPCQLTLTGPAGGSWTWGSGGPTLELDAVGFCRLLSGRDWVDGVRPQGLLGVEVPF